ncbi:9251_t:CDS:2, partial [Ambispora gerdemannii]
MGLSSLFQGKLYQHIFSTQKTIKSLLKSQSISTLNNLKTNNPKLPNNKPSEPSTSQPIPKKTAQNNITKFKYEIANTENAFAINLCHIPEDIYFSQTTTNEQLQTLFAYLQYKESLKFVHQLTFNQSPITHESIISILKDCENLQQIFIIGGRNIALRKVTKTLVRWKQDESGDSPNLASLKRIVVTRCVGGKRHNYKAQKVDNDMKVLDQEVFQLVDCDDLNCEECTKHCQICGIKYKYWDRFWIACGWCRKRNFCGRCVLEATEN